MIDITSNNKNMTSNLFHFMLQKQSIDNYEFG